MTEAELMACNEPWELVRYLKKRISGRKLTLFTCACCRRIWPLLKDRRSRAGVEIAELNADGMATKTDLLRIRQDASKVTGVGEVVPTGAVDEWFAVQVCRIAALAAWQVPTTGGTDAWDAEREWQCMALRDVVGNPFRLPPVNRGWKTPTVIGIATAAYEHRFLPSGELDPARLTVLADALEDAGCQEPDILAHLRSAGLHVRGCWAVDLLLGKE